MLKDSLSSMLRMLADRLDAGSSELTEEQSILLMQNIAVLTDTSQPMSKYQACEHIGISRALFDNYVREGKLPKGYQIQGATGLFWHKCDIENFKKNYKKYERTCL